MKLLSWFRCRNLLLFLLASGLLFFAFPQTTFPWYARLFTVDDKTKGADALVMLAGSPGSRTGKAAELMKAGYAPMLYLTDPVHPYPPELADKYPRQNDLVMAWLDREGVAYQVIPGKPGGATSTFDEAYDVAERAKKEEWKRIIVVTDMFHTRRARYAFEKVFRKTGAESAVQMAASRPVSFSEENWWHSEAGLSAYLLEPLKLFFYHFADGNLKGVKEK